MRMQRRIGLRKSGLSWVGLSALSVIAAFSLRANAAEVIKPPRQPKEIAGANNDLDVLYLPARRGESREVRMNVHWPNSEAATGQVRKPCIIIVHGGSYTGGEKDEGGYQSLAERALAKGFVVANLNYILNRGGDTPDGKRGDRNGIFPQVYWDFKAAVRFLRKNADKYQIDPDRMGAWGFSAGGWLVSSGSYSDAGDLHAIDSVLLPASSSMDPKARRDRFARSKSKLPADFPALWTPMDDPDPAYPEFSSRVQALAYDWGHHPELLTSDDPPLITYVGQGGKNDLEPLYKTAGLDFVAVTIPDERFKGAPKLHVPNNLSKVLSEDGKTEIELRDRVLEFYTRQLMTDARTPAPEFRPNLRVFTDTARVQIVVPSSDIVVHYTTDGSEPTSDSPVYKAPLAFSATTTIQAICMKKGSRPSGVAGATFTQVDTLPPTVAGPAELPSAKVGVHYSVKLTVQVQPTEKSASQRVIWDARIQDGSLGLTIDKQTGVLSGTPTRAGPCMIQVRVGHGPHAIAGTRTYNLDVAP